MKVGTERAFGPDLVRASAVTLVLAVHFFMNGGFYTVPFQGGWMAVNGVFRMACMTCVPLFLVLSGYLCLHRKWDRGYLLGLLPVLAVYGLAGVCCLAFKVLYLKETISLMGLVGQLLSYDAAPYAWYIEMYIGLYLLMPFLNAAWHSLETGGKRTLMLVFLFLTALPPLVNQWRHLLPDWWTGLYPVTYYFLGAWLREHPLRLKKRWLLLGWLGTAALAGLGIFAVQQVIRPGTPALSWGIWNWESLVTVAETVCLFSLLVSCEGEKCPVVLRRLVRRVAALSLPIYLMSYISDKLLYPALTALVPEVGERLVFLPAAVVAGLALSGVMARAVQWAAEAALRLLPKKTV